MARANSRGDKEFAMVKKATLGAKALGRRELENNEKKKHTWKI
jgi:hypothetical protein